MNKNTILKIAGGLIGPLLIMTIGLYLFYPYLNEEKYRQVSEKFAAAPAEFVGTSATGNTATTDSLSGSAGEALPQAGEHKPSPEDSLTIENSRLQAANDSLHTANEELKLRLKERTKVIEDSLSTAKAASEEQDQDLAERIKSLLNLDEEQLAPIVNEMTDQQLVRLYEKSGTMQRRKLLRSLEPARAAKLMTEIMS